MLLQSTVLRVVDVILGIVAVAYCRIAVTDAAALSAPSIYMKNYLLSLQYAVGLSLAFNVLMALSQMWSLIKERRTKTKADEESPGNSGEVLWFNLLRLCDLMFPAVSLRGLLYHMLRQFDDQVYLTGHGDRVRYDGVLGGHLRRGQVLEREDSDAGRGWQLANRGDPGPDSNSSVSFEFLFRVAHYVCRRQQRQRVKCHGSLHSGAVIYFKRVIGR